MVNRSFNNGVEGLRNLALIFVVTVPVMVASCRTADICLPGMVFIKGRVVPCGYSDKLVFLEVESFYIDVTEVTNEAYEKFIKADGYGKKEYWSTEGWQWKVTYNVTAPLFWKSERFSDPEQPVVGVHYYEAEAYAKWAGKRLPTEVEWELASRGTNAGYYPWDGPFDALAANTAEYWRIRLGRWPEMNNEGCWEPPEARPTRVKNFEKDCSPFGCYDMCGNAAEWCQISKEIPDKDGGPLPNARFVARGGSWLATNKYCTLARRLFCKYVHRSEWMGFRCAMSYRSEK